MQIELVIQLPDTIKEQSKIINYVTNKLQQSSLTQSVQTQVQDYNYNDLSWTPAEPIQLGDNVVDWGVKSLPGSDPFYFKQDDKGATTFGNLSDES